jgi:hypothetical protein
LPAAFKGSIACGVQRFICLRRSRVQLPAAFNGSIACGVQGFNCLRRSRVPASFLAVTIKCCAFMGSIACGIQGSIACGVQGFKVSRVLEFGFWDLEFGTCNFHEVTHDLTHSIY